MRKYNLTRLKSLSLAVIMMATLSSCKDNTAPNTDSKVTLEGPFNSYFNTLEKIVTDRLSSLEKEALAKIKEEMLTTSRVIEAFETSDYYNENTKLFIKDFLTNASVPKNVLEEFLKASAGDIESLKYLLSFEKSAFVFGYNPNYFDKVVNNRNLQIFDNRKDIIPSLPSTYLAFIRVKQCGNFNIYISLNLYHQEDKDFTIITDLDNRIIAHTNKEYTEIEGKKFQLTNFNWKLKKLGLEYMAKKDYSIAELMNIHLAISQAYIDISNNKGINTAKICVFDTTNCLISDRINGRNPYYFLEYIGADIFNKGGHFFRDILNDNAIAYFDEKYNYFCYIDLTKKFDKPFYESTGEYIYEEPLCIDSTSFAFNQTYFSSLNDFLTSNNYYPLIQSTYVKRGYIRNISNQVTNDFFARILIKKDDVLIRT